MGNDRVDPSQLKLGWAKKERWKATRQNGGLQSQNALQLATDFWMKCRRKSMEAFPPTAVQVCIGVLKHNISIITHKKRLMSTLLVFHNRSATVCAAATHVLTRPGLWGKQVLFECRPKSH